MALLIFHPRLSHKGTFVNMELTLPPAPQGLDWFWTAYKEEWKEGWGKEDLRVKYLITLESLISCIPSPAPVLQPH